MKFADIKNLEVSELRKKLLAAKKELAYMRFKNKMGRLENAMLIRQQRRDIARIKTAMAQKKDKASKV